MTPKSKLLLALIVTAVAVTILVWRFPRGATDRVPTYDWECAQCQYRFRHAVENAAGDVAVLACPKCKAKSAERLMHFQCRKCWNKYDLRGTLAILSNVICPACGSRAARDLDHPIPGDNEPVDGGLPYPGPR